MPHSPNRVSAASPALSSQQHEPEEQFSSSADAVANLCPQPSSSSLAAPSVNGTDRLSYFTAPSPTEQYSSLRCSLALQVQETRKNLLKSLDESETTDDADLLAAAAAVDNRVKVFMRVRPASPPLGENESTVIIGDDQRTLTTIAPETSHRHRVNRGSASTERVEYSYSRVFDSTADQSQVYESVMSGLIESVTQGTNALMFAYGVTNSGKTHTVHGSVDQPGLLPRALCHLFSWLGDRIHDQVLYKPVYHSAVHRLNEKELQTLLALKEQLLGTAGLPRSNSSASLRSMSSLTSHDSIPDMGENSSNVSGAPYSEHSRYCVFVSFVEVYNENVYDLLVPAAKGNVKRSSLRLGEKDNCTYIKNMTEVPVHSAEEAQALLNLGQRNLQVAATSLNHNSSRSHCIFNVRLLHLRASDHSQALYSTTPSFTVAAMSRLTVCDLAGTERGRRTQQIGTRMQEASKINNSLGALRACIAAVKWNQAKPAGQHRLVPFRDSCLTRIFQPCFSGGSGRIAMIININPAPCDYDETAFVLKFSALAKKVRVLATETDSVPEVHGVPVTVAAPAQRPVAHAHVLGTLNEEATPKPDHNHTATANGDTSTIEDDSDDGVVDEYTNYIEHALEEYKKYSRTLKGLLIDEKRKNKRQREQIEQEVRDEVCGVYTQIIEDMRVDGRKRQLDMETVMEELGHRRIELYLKAASVRYAAKEKRAQDAALEGAEEEEVGDGADQEEDEGIAAERTATDHLKSQLNSTPPRQSRRLTRASLMPVTESPAQKGAAQRRSCAPSIDDSEATPRADRPNIAKHDTVAALQLQVQTLQRELSVLRAQLADRSTQSPSHHSCACSEQLQTLTAQYQEKEQMTKDLEQCLTEAGEQFMGQEKRIAELQAQLEQAQSSPIGAVRMRADTGQGHSSSDRRSGSMGTPPQTHTPGSAGTPDTLLRASTTTAKSIHRSGDAGMLPQTYAHVVTTSSSSSGAGRHSSPVGVTLSPPTHGSPMSMQTYTPGTGTMQRTRSRSPYRMAMLTDRTAALVLRATDGEEGHLPAGDMHTDALLPHTQAYRPPTVDGRASPQPLHSTMIVHNVSQPQTQAHGLPALGVSAVGSPPQPQDPHTGHGAHVNIKLNDHTLDMDKDSTPAQPQETQEAVSNEVLPPSSFFQSPTHTPRLPSPMTPRTPLQMVQPGTAHEPPRVYDLRDKCQSLPRASVACAGCTSPTSTHRPNKHGSTRSGSAVRLNRAAGLRMAASPQFKHNHLTGSFRAPEQSAQPSPVHVTRSSTKRKSPFRDGVRDFVSKWSNKKVAASPTTPARTGSKRVKVLLHSRRKSLLHKGGK